VPVSCTIMCEELVDDDGLAVEVAAVPQAVRDTAAIVPMARARVRMGGSFRRVD